MIHSIITHFVIASLIACPLWCTDAVDSCCAGDHSIHNVTQTPAGCCSRCDHKQESQDQKPCEQDNACQGICGGVVLLEPVKLIDNNGSDAFFAVMTLTADNCSSTQNTAHCLPGVPNNYGLSGRSLRTRHCSYLC